MDSPDELNAVFQSVEENMHKQLPHCCGSPITKRNEKWAVWFLWISPSLPSIATAKKGSIQCQLQQILFLCFLKWRADHCENFPFNSHQESHHPTWPLLAVWIQLKDKLHISHTINLVIPSSCHLSCIYGTVLGEILNFFHDILH